MWAHTTLHWCPNRWSGRMYDSWALLTASSTAKLDRARPPCCGYLQFIYSSAAFGNGSLPLKFGQVWNCRVIKLARRHESPLKRRLAASQVTVAEGSGAGTITIFIRFKLFWNHADYLCQQFPPHEPCCSPVNSRENSWESNETKVAEVILWEVAFCRISFQRIQFAGFH